MPENAGASGGAIKCARSLGCLAAWRGADPEGGVQKLGSARGHRAVRGGSPEINHLASHSSAGAIPDGKGGRASGRPAGRVC